MEVEQVKAAATSSWSELPADRIGQVLLRLPSLADRVRLRAVCRPWRTDAQRQPALPSPLPWFALRDGGLVDQHGAPVRCSPFLRQGVFEYLAVDNLAFLVHKDGGCSLVNPLSASMAATLLPQLAYAVLRAMNDSKFDCYTLERTKMPYAKVILSSPLDSSRDTLVAALILGGDYVAVAACKRHDVIGFGSVSDWTQEDVYMTIPNMDYKMCLADIAFLHGRLYTLTVKEGLYVFGSDSGYLNASSGFHQCITDDPKQQRIYKRADLDYMVPRYLAACDGRLFMVKRWMRYPPIVRLGAVDRGRTYQFEVFEADLNTTPCRWRKVDGLGGHAIFLGSECTKFVRASKCVGGVQEDCIYFMHWIFDNPSREYFGPCVDPLGDSGVYNMRNGEITPLLPEAMMAKLCLKCQFLTWFFPADV